MRCAFSILRLLAVRSILCEELLAAPVGRVAQPRAGHPQRIPCGELDGKQPQVGRPAHPEDAAGDLDGGVVLDQNGNVMPDKSFTVSNPTSRMLGLIKFEVTNMATV